MCPTDGSASDYCLICPTDGSALPAFLKPWSTVQLYISIETQHDFLLPKGYPTHPNTPSPFSPPQIPYSTHINDYPTWTITPPSKRLPNTPKHPFPIFPPSNSVLYPHQRLPNMDYHLFVHGSKSHEEGGGGEETGLTAVGGRGVQTPPPTCNASGQLSPRICTERIHSSTQ